MSVVLRNPDRERTARWSARDTKTLCAFQWLLETISKTLEQQFYAAKLNEAKKIIGGVPVADQQASKVAEVSEEPLNLTLTLKLRTPGPLVTPQLSTVLRIGLFAVFPVRDNRLEALYFEFGVQ